MGENDEIEWDDMKDADNRARRGLPFVLAAVLFDGRPRMDTVSSKAPLGEARFETMAEVEGRVLFCVWTCNGERRRIISLRMAHRSDAVRTKKQLEEAARAVKMIDWSFFDAMSDEEIRQHWAWDKDMTWPTDEELANFDLVIPAKSRRKSPEAAE